MARVFWAVPMGERADEREVNVLMNVAAHCETKGYTRLHFPPAARDVARNKIAKAFYDASSDPDDVLVLLDQDHRHPFDVVERLAERQGAPIVSALAFRRIHDYAHNAPDPLMWVLEGKMWKIVRTWPKGEPVTCDMAGFGAIAIRRQVFTDISQKVRPYPWFRNEYKDGLDDFPREDWVFGLAARQAGYRFVCDTGLVVPHYSWTEIDEETWEQWQALEAESHEAEGGSKQTAGGGQAAPAAAPAVLPAADSQLPTADHQVDIIIPGWGNLDLTRKCLDSLAQTEGATYQVIYVDQGSDLADVTALMADYPHLQVARFPLNRGFVSGINAGMVVAGLSAAPYVLWLNNDVEVPAGDSTWLARLLKPMEVYPDIWATGAVSDRVYGVQQRPGPGVGHREAAYLIGFCLCVRKSAVRLVGLADERFNPGNYEDTDYSLRLRAAGGRLVVVDSVWLHHARHKTFERLPESLGAILQRNRAQFVKKWGVVRLQEMGVSV